MPLRPVLLLAVVLFDAAAAPTSFGYRFAANGKCEAEPGDSPPRRVAGLVAPNITEFTTEFTCLSRSCGGRGSTAARGTRTFHFMPLCTDMEVLQWVRENDADGEAWWDEDCVRRNAAGPRKQEVLTWLDERTGP